MVDQKNERREKQGNENDDYCLPLEFRPGRPAHLSHLQFDVVEKFADLFEHIARSPQFAGCRSHFRAGLEGLEPPTAGFGVRCTSHCATGLYPLVIAFPCAACAYCTSGNILRIRLARNACACSWSCCSCAACIPSIPVSPGLSFLPQSRFYSMILVTTPAPTVRPPSRIANRKPSSIAISDISSPVTVTLSPGITISTPSGSTTSPVTSVVRK